MAPDQLLSLLIIHQVDCIYLPLLIQCHKHHVRCDLLDKFVASITLRKVIPPSQYILIVKEIELLQDNGIFRGVITWKGMISTYSHMALVHFIWLRAHHFYNFVDLLLDKSGSVVMSL